MRGPGRRHQIPRLQSRVSYVAAGRKRVKLVCQCLIEGSPGTDHAKDKFTSLMRPVNMVPTPDGHTATIARDVVGTLGRGIITVRVGELLNFLG